MIPDIEIGERVCDKYTGIEVWEVMPPRLRVLPTSLLRVRSFTTAQCVRNEN